MDSLDYVCGTTMPTVDPEQTITWKDGTRKAHPNLYEVWALFQREQAATEVTIQQLEAGGVRKAKRRKVVQREEKIKSLQHEPTTGERKINSYLSY